MKNFNTKSAIDNAILFFSLLIAFACILFLFTEIKLTDYFDLDSTDKKGQSLAILKSKNNNIRKKKSGSLSWKDLQVNEPLFIDDQIFTAKNATGVIEFKDKSRVEMAPNTLLKIEARGDQTEVNLLKGFVLADSSNKNGTLRVKSGQTSIDISDLDGQVKFQKNSKGNDQITLLGKNAVIKINGQLVKLKSNQYLDIQKNGKYKIKEILISPIYPRNGQIVYYLKNPSARFQWRLNNRINSEVFLEIDSTENFLSPKKIKVSGSEININDLKDGLYFWRLSTTPPGKKDEYYSQFETFILNEDLPPKLLSPIDQEIIPLEKNSKDQLVTIKWSDENSPQYEYQIIKNEKILKQGKTTRTIISLKGLLGGIYQWRVKNLDRVRPFSPWSQYSSFTLTNKTNFFKPENLSPLNGAKIPLARNLVNPINFSWGGDNRTTYLFEFSLDKNFTTIILNKKVNKNSFTWNSNFFGTYYWRVAPAPFNANSQIKWSAPNQINLIAAAPEIYFPENNNRITLFEPGPVEFKWEHVFFEDPEITLKTRKNFYRIQSSKDELFENILFEDKTFSSEYSWKTPRFGKIHWKTQAVPHNSTGLWSKTYRFFLQKSKPPKPPELQEKVTLKINFYK